MAHATGKVTLHLSILEAQALVNLFARVAPHSSPQGAAIMAIDNALSDAGVCFDGDSDFTGEIHANRE